MCFGARKMVPLVCCWGRKGRFWNCKRRKMVVVVPCPSASAMNGKFMMVVA